MLLCVTEATPEDVVEAAIDLCHKDTQVWVLHVVHLLNDFARKDATERYQWIMKAFKEAVIKATLEMVESTDRKTAIISFAKKINCDIIVTGTIPRKGLLGYLTDSVSDYLVKNAPSTVVIVRKAGQIV